MPDLVSPPITILEGDNLRHLLDRDAFPDQSVNLFITSPPYAQQRQEQYGGVPEDEYVQWFLDRSGQMLEICANDGSFILNIKEHITAGKVRSTYVLRLILALVEQGWEWIDELIWYKPNPSPGKRRRTLKDGWERLLHFSPTTDIKFYPERMKQPIKESTAAWRHRGDEGKKFNSSGSGFAFNAGSYSERLAQDPTALPSNVLKLPLGRLADHPAVFPKKLPEFFIKMLTDPGDVVCDPFAGSGTALAAAALLGRKGIGIEAKPEYAAKLRARFA